MNIKGQHYRTIWLDEKDERAVCCIDQRVLPHEFRIARLRSLDDCFTAIRDMTVRGAPLIGVTAAYGMYLAALAIPAGKQLNQELEKAAAVLRSARPTAINLSWAVSEQMRVARSACQPSELVRALLQRAAAIADEDVESCRLIGQHGLSIIREIAARKPRQRINVLTHCNAGWLAVVDWGTALAPVYQAYEQGIPVHVFVDETRPRNQGASLTAWELGNHGVPYSLITDNAGGHLMQSGMVDAVFVGADRITRNGDTANKIGTYLKALAARDNGIPFYVAAPHSSIDWSANSTSDVPIEERSADEVSYIQGWDEAGARLTRLRICPQEAPVCNPGFDVTPARLITGIITERGMCEASFDGLSSLYPEQGNNCTEDVVPELSSHAG